MSTNTAPFLTLEFYTPGATSYISKVVQDVGTVSDAEAYPDLDWGSVLSENL